MNKSIKLEYELLCLSLGAFSVCVCVCMCIYNGLLEFMIIDGVFYPISHTHLNDQTYDTSGFLHKSSLQGH